MKNKQKHCWHRLFVFFVWVFVLSNHLNLLCFWSLTPCFLSCLFVSYFGSCSFAFFLRVFDFCLLKQKVWEEQWSVFVCFFLFWYVCFFVSFRIFEYVWECFCKFLWFIFGVQKHLLFYVSKTAYIPWTVVLLMWFWHAHAYVHDCFLACTYMRKIAFWHIHTHMNKFSFRHARICV